MRTTPPRASTGSAARSSPGTSSATRRARSRATCWRSGSTPDVVIAIARGGLLLAGAISYALGTKACGSINVEFYSGIDERLPEPVLHPPMLDAPALGGKRVLLVDDVSDSGRTLAKVRRASSATRAPTCAPRRSTRSRTPCSSPTSTTAAPTTGSCSRGRRCRPVERRRGRRVSVHLVGGGATTSADAPLYAPFVAEAVAAGAAPQVARGRASP